SVPDELVSPHRDERRYRIRERHVPGLCETGRDADHVLLGDADVEEAVREAVGERLERVVAQVSGKQEDPRVGLTDLDERPDELAPHRRAAASSCSATSYSLSDIGM